MELEENDGIHEEEKVARKPTNNVDKLPMENV